MTHSEREQQARAYSDAGRRRAATTNPPVGQKFAPGTRVRIVDDLGSSMRHFPSARDAVVLYTYAHAYGGDDVKSYCLNIDGIGRVSWYDEDQLTAIEDSESPLGLQ